MAEAESWAGWNQAKEHVWKLNQGDWTNQIIGVCSEECEVRQDVVTSDAILGRCSSDYDEERQRFELEFEAAERVELGEEHHWTALIQGDEDFQWRTQNTKHESKRQSSTEGEFHGDTFCWRVYRGPRSNFCIFRESDESVRR